MAWPRLNLGVSTHMAESRNLIQKVGLGLTVALFLMCWLLVGGSGSITGGPVEILGVPGVVLLLATIIATFATIYIAVGRAHRAGSWFWFFSVILIWPTSYLYTLVVNRNG